jgi:isoaspartyl peptidase/L-asparaginase-like protein (Ntn-hydrolase superfamily)
MIRRDFLKNSLLTIPVISSATASAGEQTAKKPLVVSTWDFGKAANAEAWKILHNKGRALDAIEQDARVTEADESNKTVGYGGYPDRDGRVTLDACIMDENGNCGSVNEIGAATSTGVGEEVIKCVGSHLVVEYMRQGFSPGEACKKVVERIAKRDPEKAKNIQIGFLAIDKNGNYGAYALQKGFSYAVKSDKEEIVIPGESYFN